MWSSYLQAGPVGMFVDAGPKGYRTETSWSSDLVNDRTIISTDSIVCLLYVNRLDIVT